MLSIVQLSMFFVAVLATALLDYHIFRRLSTTFLNLFQTVLFDSLIWFVSRDSFVRITPLPIKVNTFFEIFSSFLNPFYKTPF